MSDNGPDTINMLPNSTSSVFNKIIKHPEEYIVDYAVLHDNVIGALTRESR